MNCREDRPARSACPRSGRVEGVWGKREVPPTTDSGAGRYAPPMSVLTSQVERESEVFAERRDRMEALVAEVRERTALVARGGGDKALERHRSRGKLPARMPANANRALPTCSARTVLRPTEPLITASISTALSTIGA